MKNRNKKLRTITVDDVVYKWVVTAPNWEIPAYIKIYKDRVLVYKNEKSVGEIITPKKISIIIKELD